MTQSEINFIKIDIYDTLLKAKEPMDFDELYWTCESVQKLKMPDVTKLLVQLKHEGRIKITVHRKLRLYQAIPKKNNLKNILTK